jgi:hypothetical protein
MKAASAGLKVTVARGQSFQRSMHRDERGNLYFEKETLVSFIPLRSLFLYFFNIIAKQFWYVIQIFRPLIRAYNCIVLQRTLGPRGENKVVVAAIISEVIKASSRSSVVSPSFATILFQRHTTA